MNIRENNVRAVVGIIVSLSLLFFVIAAGFGLQLQPVEQPASVEIPTKIGFIGDSITHADPNSKTNSPVGREVTYLGGEYEAVNTAVSGATTGDWLPGGKYFSDAMAQFEKEDVTVVSIMLGTNDSKDTLETSDIEYKLHLETIVNALLNSGSITRVILNYPPYLYPEGTGLWSKTSINRLKAYTTQIDSLVNGTTILQGDTSSFSYFRDHPEDLADGVHPNEQGYAVLGAFWAVSYLKAFADLQEEPMDTPEPEQLLQF